MSSTAQAKRGDAVDYFPTPHWCVDRLLEEFQLPRGRWLEPTAGDGAIIRAVNYFHLREAWADPPVEWTAVERETRREGTARLDEAMKLRPGVSREHARIFVGQDFREWSPPSRGNGERPGKPFDVAILNPPFATADSILRRCFALADVVVALLRVNYLGSADRNAFMRRYAPSLFVLPDRPSFDGLGTDSIEYAWFWWDSRRTGSFENHAGVVRVLRPTPLEVRTAAKEAIPEEVKAAAQAARQAVKTRRAARKGLEKAQEAPDGA